RTCSPSLGQGKFPTFLYAWFADVPHPDNFLFKLFYSRSPRNFTGYANGAVDDLLLQAKRERDLKRQMEIYREAERLVMADAPVMPIWHYTYERLFQPYVRSVEVNGLGDPYIALKKIWLDGRARTCRARDHNETPSHVAASQVPARNGPDPALRHGRRHCGRRVSPARGHRQGGGGARRGDRRKSRRDLAGAPAPLQLH